jgi:DNA-binding MarR family transcriptional regulator
MPLPDDLRSSRLRELYRAVSDDTVSKAHLVASAAIFRSHRIVVARVEAVLAPLGLNAARFEALGLIATADHGRVTFTDLKRATLQHAATVTYNVDMLERRGLVRRLPDPNDRRAVVAEITPEGAELARVATSILNGIDFGLSEASVEDAERVAMLLSTLHDD